VSSDWSVAAVTEPADVWDVAVIGGGPAGAMAALAAASRGMRVVLLERFALPRYKTCAGGLVGAALRALPDGFTVPVQATATQFALSFPGRPTALRSGDFPLVSLVHRSEFDALLVGRATAAGAVVRDGVTVLADLAASGDLHIPIAATYPLTAVQDAYRALARRKAHGRIVLHPQDVT
jgi:flavin-dependent dehydrogenase